MIQYDVTYHVTEVIYFFINQERNKKLNKKNQNELYKDLSIL